MRIGPLLITIYVLYAAIALMQGTISIAEYNGQSTLDVAYENATDGDAAAAADSVWQIFNNPSTYFRSDFFSVFLTLITAGGIIAIGVGIYMKSDMVLLAGLLGFFGALFIIPVRTIYSFLQNGMKDFMCPSFTASQACGPSLLITSLLVGGLTLLYILAVIEWWTARPLNK